MAQENYGGEDVKYGDPAYNMSAASMQPSMKTSPPNRKAYKAMTSTN